MSSKTEYLCCTYHKWGFDWTGMCKRCERNHNKQSCNEYVRKHNAERIKR